MRSLMELSNLSGRRALITGGAGHIGMAAAEALTELGAVVAIVDFDADICRIKSMELNEKRVNCAVPVSCDLADEQSTRSAVQKVIQELGGLEIIVHSAAFVGTTKYRGWAEPFERQSVNAWDRALRVNLTAPFILVQEAQVALEKTEKGSVILIASTYGLVGPDMRLYDGTTMANPAAYGASKGGLLQLTRYLATTLAPHVRVNAISPGGIWRDQPEVFRKRYEARTPLCRMGTEEDLKGAVAYLASDLSNYATGHNLIVDGGFTAW
jgi:NAD(P)-dependent dehydrogenase (short-subunit alcohol dehydrogenase family)